MLNYTVVTKNSVLKGKPQRHFSFGRVSEYISYGIIVNNSVLMRFMYIYIFIYNIFIWARHFSLFIWYTDYRHDSFFTLSTLFNVNVSNLHTHIIYTYTHHLPIESFFVFLYFMFGNR